MIVVGFYGPHDIISLDGSRYFITHDHNITIMENSILKYYLHLERYTNIKHDNAIEKYMEDIFKKYVIALDNNRKDIVIIFVNSFLGNSFISNNGGVRIEGGNISIENMISEASGHIYLTPTEISDSNPNKLFQVLNDLKPKTYIMTHEIAHIFTNLPYYGPFKKNSLLVHIDGGAYQSNSSVWYYDGKTIHLISYGWNDLKDVVNIFNANPLSFFILNDKATEHLSLPGKIMGYSSYGEPNEKIEHWLKENNYFLDFTGESEEMLDIINREFSLKLSSFDIKNKFIMDLVATLQNIFEIKILEYIKKYKNEIGADYLYYSGGAALNIKTNAKIEDTLGFKKVFIPPSCNDSGLSLGATYGYLWLNNIKFDTIHPYINNIYPKNGNHADKFVSGVKVYEREESFNKLIEMLVKRKVVGMYVGDGEAGPRALGHRSIFARPDDVSLRVRVSEKIKLREWYRPVAPIVLDYVAKKSFRECIENSVLGRYMLREYHLKDEFIQYFRGVVHVDGTVRPQILFKDFSDDFLYSLLETLLVKHEIYGLINTSFNVKGKPMVQGEMQALYEGKKTGLDGVYINGRLYIF